MASGPAPLKSILRKNQASPSPSTSASDSKLPVPKSDAERKKLDIAIQHAQLIQEQKEAMRRNLDVIEELAEYPSASTPTTAETEKFLSSMVYFQPSDYDALIEERHVNNLCGYTLCANVPRKLDLKRPWLRPKGSENWCSDDCARRALYIKAQLDETPAWERRAGMTTPFVLYDGDKKHAPSKQQPSPGDQTMTNHRDLAVERGEVKKIADSKMEKVMKVDVFEKQTSGTASPPSQTTFADSSIHDLIEGYQPRGIQKGGHIRLRSEGSDDDDEE